MKNKLEKECGIVVLRNAGRVHAPSSVSQARAETEVNE